MIANDPKKASNRAELQAAMSRSVLERAQN